MIKFKKILATLVAVVGISVLSPANAASQCSGLSSSMCSAKASECTWRKSSVNKNGVKTKAYCRALPGKSKDLAKTTDKSKKTASKAKASIKKETTSAKDKVSSKKASSTKYSADAKKKASSVK